MKAIATVSLLAAAAAAVAADKPVPDSQVYSFVESHVRQFQPTRAEKRFDEIGWAANILDAERLAKEANRPVFVFTHNGAINTGRC
jgi:hypothetical protein